MLDKYVISEHDVFDASILIVDDQQANVQLPDQILRRICYSTIGVLTLAQIQFIQFRLWS